MSERAKPKDRDVCEAMDELEAAQSRLPFVTGEAQRITMEQIDNARRKLNTALRSARNYYREEEISTCATTESESSGTRLKKLFIKLW